MWLVVQGDGMEFRKCKAIDRPRSGEKLELMSRPRNEGCEGHKLGNRFKELERVCVRERK